MEEDSIVAQLNDLPLDKTEEDVRTLLGVHHSKQLRTACTKLRLGAQKRGSTQNNKSGYIGLLYGYYKAKCDGMVGALEGRTTEASGTANVPFSTQRRIRLQNIPPSLLTGMIPESARMSSLAEPCKHILEHSEMADSSSQGSAKRCRRLTTAERILELLEKDRDDELEERKLGRDEGKCYDVVARASAAVEAATKALNGLKANFATASQVEAAEVGFDKLITAWTHAMTKASEQ